jgi:arsenate reductase
MTEPLTREELSTILDKLQMKAHELVRTNEALYKNEYEGRRISDAEWVELLIAHPELMQRPIAVKDDHAIIARPPEKILTIL